MSSADALISVEDLSVHIGSKPLLRALSFALSKAENLTLVGESGAGKSLMAQAIMGTLPAPLRAGGKVAIAGRASPAPDAGARRSLWGRVLGMLPQEPWIALDPTMRVHTQLAEVHRLVRGLPASAAEAQAEAGLQDIGIEKGRALYPWQLSGGMAQRVAFTIALAGGARVLLVDEPTKGLDAHRRAQILAALISAREAGSAVITITHDLRLAEALGGQLIVLREGEVVEQGEASQVLSAPCHAYTQALVAAKPDCWPARPIPVSGDLLLEGKGLAKGYDGRILFRNVDIALRDGERIAIRGPSGVGKTTLGNILIGLQRADSGSVSRHAKRPAVAYQKLYQDPVASFPPHITLRRALEDLVRLHGKTWPAMAVHLESLRVPENLLLRRPDQVSGGELQRIALARVLLVEPTLVFADEPTSRLDPITQKEAMDVLVEQASAQGFALVLVTHDESLAANVATRSLVLSEVPDDVRSTVATAWQGGKRWRMT